jgi:hypothetical protein
MIEKHAPGTTVADPSKPSIANMPYELQVAIIEAATGPQVIFLDIVNDTVSFAPPANMALAMACRLTRQHYLKGKRLHRFGHRAYWIDRDFDIFYLSRDDPIPRVSRPNSQSSRPPSGAIFDPRAVHHVAVDLQYLGPHPHYDPLVRIWSVFPHMKAIHVLVPKGPPQTPALQATPATLALSDIAGAHVVAAPGMDRELWFAVRYQVKKMCARILAAENGWHGRYNPDVLGHLTSLAAAASEDVA